ncbi:MAG: MFS transporter [Armatimonadota bacterium]|jgi:nucleoside transporter
MLGGVRWRLSAMMFLQYAIWGAWAPVLWAYLVGPTDPAVALEQGVAVGLGFSQTAAGTIFGLLWLACILAPFTGGQIADRWVPTQWFLAAVHIAGGAILLVLSRETGFAAFTGGMALYSLLYAPTLALTNSLAFHHLKSEKEFGSIRVWGTIGWIVAGWGLTGWRGGYLLVNPPLEVCDSLMLGGIFALIMGAFCFTLPHTPPAREAADPLAFRKAFVMLKDRNFLTFMLIAFVVTTELQFYYGPTPQFLEGAMKIDNKWIPLVMTVAQIAEIIAMAVLLPIGLRVWGIRKCLAVGVIAWPIRYIFFSLGPIGPLAIMRPLVIASMTLHGLGYTFFFVVSQIFVDMVSPRDIRASAQSLLTLVTLGVGNWLGTQFTGYIVGKFLGGDSPYAWTYIYLVPCALTVACAIAFLLLFKDPEAEGEAQAEAPDEEAA